MSRPTVGPFTTTAGRHRRVHDWVMFAEDGLVVIEDEKTGDLDAKTVKSAQFMLVARRSELEILDRKKQALDPLERAYAIEFYAFIRQWCDVLAETIYDARQQGDPGDPQVRRQKLIEFLRARRHGGLVGADGARLPAPDTLFKVQAEEDARPHDFPHLPKTHRPIWTPPPETPDGYRPPR